MQLTADNLVVKRGGRTIINDLSFSLRAGEALLLTGRNGAGKTTLIRTIAGFLRPSKGKLVLSDHGEAAVNNKTGASDAPHACNAPPERDEPYEIAEQCHYVGHLNAVKASLTVEENLSFWARFLAPGIPVRGAAAGGNGNGKQGQAPDAQPDDTLPADALPDGALPKDALAVASALQQFNLDALRHIPAGYLSAGQKRRLGLARLALVHRPLWLLDEPTVSLDTASQEILAKAVNTHVKSGGMAIAATHLPLGLAAPRELRLGGPGPGLKPGASADTGQMGAEQGQ